MIENNTTPAQGERGGLADALNAEIQAANGNEPGANAKPIPLRLQIHAVKRTPLADFKRDVNQANTLIVGGWAKRGGISMHVSTTGSGKSVLQTQSALCFHQGIACCGLTPTHPFKM